MENVNRHSLFSILHLNLLVLSVQLVLAAATTEFIELKPIRRVLFILGRDVVALFALSALQNYVISWHKKLSFQHSAVSIQQHDH